MQLDSQSGNQVRIDFLHSFANLNTQSYWYSTSHVINLNSWNHIVVSYNNTDRLNDPIIYVNGSSVAITASRYGSGSAISDASNNLYIGNLQANSRTFDGFIDDAKFYNYIRTPAQISWSYNKGKPLVHYKLDECSGSIAYNTAPTATGSGTIYNGTISAGDTSGSNDSVGTCSSGTATEMWNNGTTGKFGASLDFDGTNDKVDLGDLSFTEGASQLTWSLWAKPATVGNGRTFIVKSEITPSINGTWGISSSGTNSTTIVFSIPTTTSDSNTYGYTSTGVFAADTWIHIVGVYDGTQSGNVNRLKLYLNGNRTNMQYMGTIPTATIANSINASIGTSSDGLLAFDGLLDDVQIFSYPLNPTQIKSLYAGGAAVRF
jgi:hypothetical protein